MISASANISKEEIQVLNILRKNPYCVSILKFVKGFSDEELWIGGGFIRSIIWDSKHDHQVNTEFGDIDVFYFNPKCINKAKDIEIENILRKIAPNVEWSVKNQARMHLHNNDEAYTSLTDAVSKFPDTASAIIVRINDQNDLEFIAPYGYSDLFNLVVRPTPFFLNNDIKMQRYNQRVNDKNWNIKWPNLTFA